MRRCSWLRSTRKKSSRTSPLTQNSFTHLSKIERTWTILSPLTSTELLFKVNPWLIPSHHANYDLFFFWLMLKELFDIAGRRAVPTGMFHTNFVCTRHNLTCFVVFIISIKDGLVHFVGDPASVNEVVNKVLEDYWHPMRIECTPIAACLLSVHVLIGIHCIFRITTTYIISMYRIYHI